MSLFLKTITIAGVLLSISCSHLPPQRDPNSSEGRNDDENFYRITFESEMDYFLSVSPVEAKERFSGGTIDKGCGSVNDAFIGGARENALLKKLDRPFYFIDDELTDDFIGSSEDFREIRCLISAMPKNDDRFIKKALSLKKANYVLLKILLKSARTVETISMVFTHPEANQFVGAGAIDQIFKLKLSVAQRNAFLDSLMSSDIFASSPRYLSLHILKRAQIVVPSEYFALLSKIASLGRSGASDSFLLDSAFNKKAAVDYSPLYQIFVKNKSLENLTAAELNNYKTNIFLRFIKEGVIFLSANKIFFSLSEDPTLRSGPLVNLAISLLEKDSKILNTSDLRRLIEGELRSGNLSNDTLKKGLSLLEKKTAPLSEVERRQMYISILERKNLNPALFGSLLETGRLLMHKNPNAESLLVAIDKNIGARLTDSTQWNFLGSTLLIMKQTPLVQEMIEKLLGQYTMSDQFLNTVSMRVQGSQEADYKVIPLVLKQEPLSEKSLGEIALLLQAQSYNLGTKPWFQKLVKLVGTHKLATPEIKSKMKAANGTLPTVDTHSITPMKF